MNAAERRKLAEARHGRLVYNADFFRPGFHVNTTPTSDGSIAVFVEDWKVLTVKNAHHVVDVGWGVRIYYGWDTRLGMDFFTSYEWYELFHFYKERRHITVGQ